MGVFDLTVGVGALKCLLVLGVRFVHLRDRNDGFSLSHQGVQVLGLHYNTKSSGEFVHAIGEKIKDAVHANGYSHKIYQKLEDILAIEYQEASPTVTDFIDAALNAVWDEVEKLKPRQVVLGDSRVIESIFGKFKQSTSSQLQGITIGALGIATFMACNETTEVKKAMEMTTMGQVLKWGKKHIGDSLASLRRKFFPTQKKEWKR